MRARQARFDFVALRWGLMGTVSTTEHDRRGPCRRDRDDVNPKCAADYTDLLRQLLNRTPGPPPFSSMNSIPAASRARRMARSLGIVIEVTSSASSARLI